VKQTVGGDYIVTGKYSNIRNGTNEDIFLLKVSSGGALIWSKSIDIQYNGENVQWAYDVIETASGNYVIAGTMLGWAAMNIWMPVLIQTDNTGGLTWAKEYSLNTGNSGFRSVHEIQGGFILGGYMGNTYQTLLRTDATGNTSWAKVYNINNNSSLNMGYSSIPSSNGGFLITGHLTDNGDQALIAIKTDLNGASGCNESVPALGGTGNTLTTITFSTPAVTVLSGGTSQTANPISPAASTIETTKCSGTSIMEIAGINFSALPNPTEGRISITAEEQVTEASVFDLNGRLLMRLEPHNKYFMIDLSTKEPGIYFIKIMNTKGQAQINKIVVY
jgi:hypothetical protein